MLMFNTEANLLMKRLSDALPGHLAQRSLLVGGAVRDLARGMVPGDFDLLCLAQGDELRANGFHRVTGRSAGEVFVRHLPSLGRVEATCLESLGQLPAELARRDFTVNAMAVDFHGRLHDPLRGAEDLAWRRLRPCYPLIFADDPARIFRAFRFFSDGWQPSDDLLHLLADQIRLASVQQLPVERFSGEMLKALASTDPGQFFTALTRYPASNCFLPEIAAMAAIPAGPATHHPEGDLLSHAGEVLQRMILRNGSSIARFCAFFHDLGKLATDPQLYPRHHGHEEAGAGLADALCVRLKLPNSYRRGLRTTCLLHGQVNRWEELRPATRLKVVEQALKGGIVDFLPDLSLCDKPRHGGLPGWNQALRIARLPLDELAIELSRLMALDEERRGDFIRQRRVKLLTSLHDEG